MPRSFRLPLACTLVAVGAIVAGALTQPRSSAADTPADLKPYAEKVGESSFDMLPIPGGTFTMGSPPSEKGRSPDEGPQVKVRVGPFWMAKVETSWDLYDLYWKDENITE